MAMRFTKGLADGAQITASLLSDGGARYTRLIHIRSKHFEIIISIQNCE